MNLDQLLNSITPEAYENLKYAVETGRWPNGDQLTEEQRQNCLQAIIAYDLKHKDQEDRVGFIDRSKKEQGRGKDEWQPLPIGDTFKSDP